MKRNCFWPSSILLILVCWSPILLANKPFWATDVFFDAGSSEVASADLKKIIAEVPAVPSRTLCGYGTWLVIGHADISDGINEVLNMSLSEQRTAVIKDALIKAGVNASFIHLEHKGTSQPVAKSPNKANRRVEIEFAPCE